MQIRRVLVILLMGLFLCQPVVTALCMADDQNQGDDLGDYWGDDADQWPENGDGTEDPAADQGAPPANIFLKTSNIFLKSAWFVGLTILAYLLAWGVFFGLVEHRPPARLFTACFLGFMAAVFIIGFICFSEYTLAHGYNTQTFYLSQLRWSLILLAAVFWLILSMVTTKVLKG